MGITINSISSDWEALVAVLSMLRLVSVQSETHIVIVKVIHIHHQRDSHIKLAVGQTITIKFMFICIFVVRSTWLKESWLKECRPYPFKTNFKTFSINAVILMELYIIKQ